MIVILFYGRDMYYKILMDQIEVRQTGINTENLLAVFPYINQSLTTAIEKTETFIVGNEPRKKGALVIDLTPIPSASDREPVRGLYLARL